MTNVVSLLKLFVTSHILIQVFCSTPGDTFRVRLAVEVLREERKLQISRKVPR